MDKRKDIDRYNEICIVPRNMLQYMYEVMKMSEYNIKLIHRVYRDICEKLGIEAALTIHQMFKGTQVNFPIKFFDKKSIKEMIIREYDGKNVKILARKYDYSEKSVRRIIKSSVKKK